MSKIICSPGSYIQGSGEMKKLAEYYQSLGSNGAYLIVDKFINDAYGDLIMSSFQEKQIPFTLSVFGGECCLKEIQQHQARLGTADVVIGIGGGKTLDTSKAVSYYSKVPVMIVPTAASTDAPCSRLSVIYTENGAFENYLPLPSNPNMVIMDTNIIAKAPMRFLVAGIGDALATYYEADACRRSDAVTMAGGHITNAAITLATLCRDVLLADGLKAKMAAEMGVNTSALENIVEANTYLSGIGFESSGLAAAHAIHNGLTVLEECHHMLHGEKVAFGTLSQLVLENRPMDELHTMIQFCKKLGLPTTFKALGIDQVGDEKLMRAAAASCAENDTMCNMPFEVTPEAVLSAMKVADALGSQ